MFGSLSSVNFFWLISLDLLSMIFPAAVFTFLSSGRLRLCFDASPIFHEEKKCCTSPCILLKVFRKCALYWVDSYPIHLREEDLPLKMQLWMFCPSGCVFCQYKM